MVGYNDASEGVGYSVSYDGGTRWEDEGALPHPSGWVNGGDPALTVDKNGTFYFAQLAGQPSKPSEFISLSKCTDSPTAGVNCNQPGWPKQISDTVTNAGCILPILPNPAKLCRLNDKPGITYDPKTNRVYVTWTRFGSFSTTIKLRSYDVNTGQLEKTYDLYTSLPVSMNGSYPVVTSDGVVHVFFETGLLGATSRSISYVKFKVGTKPHFFNLAHVNPTGELINCGDEKRYALDTQAFSGNPARTNEYPIATVDKDGNIDVVWNDGSPSAKAGESVIKLAVLAHGTDTLTFPKLPAYKTEKDTNIPLIQWQPTVAVAGGTNTLVVTYFQVVQQNDGSYWLERDEVRAAAGTNPTFGQALPISTNLWKPGGATNCDMGDYTGSASTPDANVVWVYWGDSRNYTVGVGPQLDVFGLPI